MRGLILIVVALLIFAAPSLVFAEVIGANNEEISVISEPILDNILDAFKTNDYGKYLIDFDDTLKESISETKFIEVDKYFQDNIGNYQSREYLGFLTKGKMSVMLWKARFDKSEDDVLIKLVVSKRSDKYLVTGLWFQ